MQFDYDVMQFDYDVTQLDYDVMQFDYDVTQLDYDVTQLDYDVTQLDYDVMQFDYDVMQLDYDVMQLDYDVMQFDHGLPKRHPKHCNCLLRNGLYASWECPPDHETHSRGADERFDTAFATVTPCWTMPQVPGLPRTQFRLELGRLRLVARVEHVAGRGERNDGLQLA